MIIRSNIIAAVLAFSSVSVLSDLKSQRHAKGAKCSLGDFEGDATPSNLCQLTPKAGLDSNGRIRMRFGEVGCTFWIHNCLLGRCYMIWDYSSLMPNDLDLGAVRRLEDFHVG